VNAIVATRSLLGRAPERGEFDITATIGTPYACEDGDWACPVCLTPLFDHLADIPGVDSFQALSLAMKLVHSLLEDFIKKGELCSWMAMNSLLECTSFCFLRFSTISRKSTVFWRCHPSGFLSKAVLREPFETPRNPFFLRSRSTCPSSSWRTTDVVVVRLHLRPFAIRAVASRLCR
jgi:hypothetical protein